MDNVIKKGIFDEWIKLIYDRLEKLNESYIRMREGCSDLLEYITMVNQKEVMEQVQYKNAGFILTYIKNILASAKPLFKEQDHNKLNAKVKFLESFHEDGITKDNNTFKVYEYKYSDLTRTNTFKLTAYYSILVKEIEKLYEELIGHIQEILFLEGNIKNK